MNEDKPLRIGFLGAGKMATALARGWIQSGLVDRTLISASDPSPAARQEFQQMTGVGAIADNATLISISDVIVIAVKPQSMASLTDEIRSLLKPKHVIVSIAAGTTLRQLSESLGKRTVDSFA